MEKGEKGGDAKESETENRKDDRSEIIAATKSQAVEIWPDFEKNNTSDINYGIEHHRYHGKEARTEAESTRRSKKRDGEGGKNRIKEVEEEHWL